MTENAPMPDDDWDRTAQFNFNALPELKPAAQRAAERAGMTLAEWMETAVQAALDEKIDT
jgi:hypothetical protein